MKLLVDFFPILLFFLAYKLYGIYTATVVAIVASFVQVGWYWFKHKRFENTHLITLAIILVFGGATLLLQDELFIKWKPTVLNWVFGIAFLASNFIGKKTIVERMMGNNISLPANIWNKLNLSWVVFFIALGFLNLYVVYNFDTDTWVNFKLFGMMALTAIFVVAQAIYMSRHAETPKAEEQ
ncbi:MAG: septation protein A [Gammaproteobacteria bacterium]|nr:septation protein A [Gammaproteobacteria bacterium]